MTRRRRLAWILVAAFLIVPIVEIYVLIQVGQVIGAWWTILLLIADSIFGSWLIRREGGRAWQALRTALREGRLPADEITDGALILVAGTLMISPGFVTDVVGIAMIVPLTRPLFRRALAGAVSRRLTAAGPVPGPFGNPFGGPFGGGRPDGTGDAGRTRQSPGPGPQGPVVRGEVVDD